MTNRKTTPRAIIMPRHDSIENARFVVRTLIQERAALRARLAEMTCDRDGWRELFGELLEAMPNSKRP